MMLNKTKLGAWLWVLGIQYYLVQFFVARGWLVPFSLKRNTISDLGNNVCGQYGSHYICSPAHTWMNLSFILIGICQAAGAILIYQNMKKSCPRNLGFGFLVLAGSGSILVGLFPENTTSGLHLTGAVLSFLFGNLALVLLGLSLKMPPALKIYTLASGYIALAATVLLINSWDLGLGTGGMERLAAYPQTIWLIIYGAYALNTNSKKG
jgi:hypothetical membrane protein